MANRGRAISKAQDQVASQRPDPVSGAAPPPPPAEIPSPPAIPVTQDRFAVLVQQIQALTHLVQERLSAPHPVAAAPAPRLPEEAAAPLSPAASSSGPHGVTDPPHRPKEARPVPQGGYGKDLPRSQPARSLSPVFSSHDSTPSPRSPRPAPPAMPEEEIRRQLQEMRQELGAVRQAPLSKLNAERHPLLREDHEGSNFPLC